MINRKSICIISFSPIYRDARVLRQIKYLSPYYDLTIIGYGPPHQDWVNRNNIEWITVENPYLYNDKLNNINRKRKIMRVLKSKLPDNWVSELFRSIIRKIKLLLSFSLVGLGRLHTSFYEVWYWRGKYRVHTMQFAINSKAHAFLANDWDSLPIAVKAAEFRNARLVFDAHEYAPLELENRWYWKPLFKPAITYFIRKYSSTIDTSVTVAPIISERYKKEFGLNPHVILNTPEREELPIINSNSDKINLVHHGGAIPDRRLELMIETLALCDSRFSLHFMLIPTNSSYLNKLKRLAEDLVPGRISFHEPVPPEEIVRRISEYDIGFCLIAPTNYNYLVSLPNKFFDYIMAGLAVCIGPSPSMAEMVNQYGFGRVASSFKPHHVAETLNRLTTEDLLRMRTAAREASRHINSEKEMKKLVEIYFRLFSDNNIVA